MVFGLIYYLVLLFVDLVFYSTMSYSIQARLQDIQFLCQHGDVSITVS